jgi:sugar lactone lactonase YvrE
MSQLTRRQFTVGLGASFALAACSTAAEISSAAPSRLLFLGQAKVFALDPASGSVTTLVDQSPTDGSRPAGVNDGIAVHAATGQIFWTNMGKAAERDGYIMRCEADGTGVTTIVTPGGTFTPKQLKIDEAAGKLYWSDREGMAIQRCNLDGSKIETLVITGSAKFNVDDQTRWCVGMALDPARGHIYWSQKGGDNAGQGVIRRVDLQMPRGSTPSNRRDMVTLFSRLPEPIDLDLDLKTRTLYWSDRGDNTISRAPMDPAAGFSPATRLDRQVLVTGLKEAIGVALDPARGRMAYTSLGGEVGIAKFDGSGAHLLHTAAGMLTGICWSA